MNKKETIIFIITMILTQALLSEDLFARDQIKIVGSSTVYPFSTIVGEELGAQEFKTPVVESTGTGGGFKLFCEGIGPKFSDIANASRAIKDSERKECDKNGVGEVVEVKFGNDGVAFVNSVKGGKINLTLNQLWKAMAAKGSLPTNWKQVSPELPDLKIEIMSPPPTSGTRDAWNDLVMKNGCDAVVKSANEKDCELFREDGVVIDAGENDALIVKKLEANPGSFGIFGYSYLESNLDKVQAAKIENVEVTKKTIQDYSYPISRPLYFYIKKAHIGVIPGIAEYATEFLSESAVGEEGYLLDVGLVPLDKESLAKVRATLGQLK